MARFLPALLALFVGKEALGVRGALPNCGRLGPSTFAQPLLSSSRSPCSWPAVGAAHASAIPRKALLGTAAAAAASGSTAAAAHTRELLAAPICQQNLTAVRTQLATAQANNRALATKLAAAQVGPVGRVTARSGGAAAATSAPQASSPSTLPHCRPCAHSCRTRRSS